MTDATSRVEPVTGDIPVMLVYGSPVNGFTHLYPVMPNDPRTVEFIDRYLSGEAWWFITPEQPDWDND